MPSRSSMLQIVFALSCAALCATALHNGFTHVEAGSWSIRNAIRLACNRGQGEPGYRKCLANAFNDINKSNFISRKLDDQCPDPRRCSLHQANVAKIKNCFNTVRVVNKSLPGRNWHANLYEDIMVGCLSKEEMNRVVHFGEGDVPNDKEFRTPYKIFNLRKLLRGTIPTRTALQNRIEVMCTNLQK